MKTSYRARILQASFAVLIVVLAVCGCAHSRERPIEAEPGPAPAPAPTPQARAPQPPEARPAPSPHEEVPGFLERPPVDASRLDPSEEITAEELATLPEPIPRSGGSTPEAGRGALPSTQPLPRPSGSGSEPQEPSDGLWRVQIYASESRAEAERVGRAAANLLRAPLAVVREGYLFKVRLGAFDSEQEAQELRDRAIRAGYPGAFRTRSMP